MIRPIILSLLLFQTTIYAELHEHNDWEFGMSVGYADLVTEDTIGTNVHLHLSKRIESDNFLQYFSYGIGAESIISDDTHYSFMTTFGYHPIEDLTLAISPSIVWENHEGGWESIYATHYEVSYVFDVSKNFHMGPVIGYSKSSEAEHYTFGIHIGFPL